RHARNLASWLALIESEQGGTLEDNMRLLPIVAAIAALSVTPLLAQQQQLPDQQRQPDQSTPESMIIGQGVICNTPDQAHRLVSLQTGGYNLASALGQVNQEAHSSTACGPALVAFRVEEESDEARLDGKPVEVVKIVVTAISDGQHWSPVPGVVQYAVMPP